MALLEFQFTSDPYTRIINCQSSLEVYIYIVFLRFDICFTSTPVGVFCNVFEIWFLESATSSTFCLP